jgi:Terminase RNaseH-like domain
VRRDDGKPLSDHYKRQGLLMLGEHATHEDGSISTEAGIMEMYTRMKTGRFKVAAHCQDWFEEFRGYCRKDGQIVKYKDDLMSATRIAVTMRRFAKSVQLGPHKPPREDSSAIADGVDFDVFSPQSDRQSKVKFAIGIDDEPW